MLTNTYQDEHIQFTIADGWKIEADIQNKSYHIKTNDGDVIMLALLSSLNANILKDQTRILSLSKDPQRVVTELVTIGNYTGSLIDVTVPINNCKSCQRSFCFMEDPTVNDTLRVEVFLAKATQKTYLDYTAFIDSIRKQ